MANKQIDTLTQAKIRVIAAFEGKGTQELLNEIHAVYVRLYERKHGEIRVKPRPKKKAMNGNEGNVANEANARNEAIVSNDDNDAALERMAEEWPAD